jgi:hypothetical protein
MKGLQEKIDRLAGLSRLGEVISLLLQILVHTTMSLMLLFYITTVGNTIVYPNRGAFRIVEYSTCGGNGWWETECRTFLP